MTSSKVKTCAKCQGNTYCAVKNGHDMCLDALLRRGGLYQENPFHLYEKYSPFTLASYLGHLDCVKLLLATGIDVNENKYYGTALQKAAQEGHYNCMEFLVSAGANVNLRNKYGATALDYALKKPHHKCIELLIDAGADVSDISIVYAVQQGNTKCVKALIEAGANVNQKYCNMTAVMSASKKGYDKCIELLVGAGADVNVQDSYGHTALNMAWRNYKCIKSLIRLGAEVNIGATFHRLCFSNSSNPVKNLKLFLAAGANVNMTSETGDSVLKYLMDHNQSWCGYEGKRKEDTINVITLLINAGGHINDVPDEMRNEINITTEISLMNMCCNAVRKHLIELNDGNLFVKVPELPLPTLLQKFLLHNVSLEDDDATSQSEDDDETSRSNEGLEELQVDKNTLADISNKGKSISFTSVEHNIEEPLAEVTDDMVSLCKYCERFMKVQSLEDIIVDAARFGHDGCVRALLNEADVNKITPNSCKETAVIVAARNSHASCVRILIEAGADVNLVEPDLAWHYVLSSALSSGSRHASCVELMIKAGVDAIDKVLQITAKEGYARCLQVFIEAGVDVNSTEGASALRHASERGHDECVTLLLNAGANVQNENGSISLFEASKNGHDKCVEALLTAGVDVNSENEDGHMALGLVGARSWDHEISAKCLNVFISAGVDVNKRDRYGFTALLYAAQNGFHRCVNRILQAGDDVNITDSNGNTALHVMFIQKSWVIFPNCIRVLLSAGIRVNEINHDGESAVKSWMSGHDLKELQSLIVHAGDNFDDVINGNSYYGVERPRRDLEVVKLLFAAGENIEAAPQEVRNMVNPHTQMCLTNLCRDVIRKHLLELDPHKNLFIRVPRLHLSEHLQKYLLFNMSLDEEEKK